MVRLVGLLGSLLLALAAPARADTSDPGEFTALGGVFPTGGVFVDERTCAQERSIVACAHLMVGTQHGATVFDLFVSAGPRLRRGRLDVTPWLGGSATAVPIVLGGLVAWPFGGDAPRGSWLRLFPFEAVGGVDVGVTLIARGRFRLRAEAGVRGHAPLFEDSRFKIPLPRGAGITIGIGAGF